MRTEWREGGKEGAHLSAVELGEEAVETLTVLVLSTSTCKQAESQASG